MACGEAPPEAVSSVNIKGNIFIYINRPLRCCRTLSADINHDIPMVGQSPPQSEGGRRRRSQPGLEARERASLNDGIPTTEDKSHPDCKLRRISWGSNKMQMDHFLIQRVRDWPMGGGAWHWVWVSERWWAVSSRLPSPISPRLPQTNHLTRGTDDPKEEDSRVMQREEKRARGIEGTVQSCVYITYSQQRGGELREGSRERGAWPGGPGAASR
jgi:hypothetical protein